MAPTRRVRNPVQAMVRKFQKQNPRVKGILGVLAAITCLIFIKSTVKHHENLFVASELVHAVGILTLVYKLQKEKNCAGLSLKSQELTAIFLAVRLYCSTLMEKDVHTVLDFVTFLVTMWVIYTIRFKFQDKYSQDLDTMPLYYVLIPCAIVAVFIHPMLFRHNVVNQILWAFCVYLEAVSVLPQLRMMQKVKFVEPFTGLYVFALGVARFIAFSYWLVQLMDRRGYLYYTWGNSRYGWWPMTVVLSELVQTFILADFCYFYVKSAVEGDLMVRTAV